MLTKDTKLRLVHALADQKTADELEKRLISTTPANPAASTAVLATLDDSDKMKKDLEERLFTALAGDGSQGREMSKKITKMLDVLKAHADGDEVAAIAASFTGQVAGMTTDVTIEADTAGAAGNSVSLAFDGVDDIDTVIAAWHLGNPSNTVTLASGDGSQVPDNGESIDLAGGADASDANTAAKQAEMGSEPMSDKAFESLVSALADRAAAQELKDAYNAMITAVQAITP